MQPEPLPVILMAMIRAAFLGAQFVGQLSRRKLEDVEVVWTGTSPQLFTAEVRQLKPTIVVVDLAEFTEGSDDQVRSLVADAGAELSIVTYSFARRQLIRSLQSQNVRVLQSPITLDVLKAHFAPFVIRNVLESARKEVSPMEQSPLPPRYTREQLGKLMEVTSTIQCECPNHVAQLVEKLQAFEAYSKDCESRNEPDRAVHASLFRSSGVARVEMEKALAMLIAHEKIEI